MTDSPDEQLDRAWKLMEKLGTAMLVTVGARGLHARPMSAILRREEDAIWFLSARDGSKDDEIARDSDVSVIFSDGGTHQVAVAGTATLSDDRARIRDLWNLGAKAFWPDGPEDPAIVAIEVRPRVIEYWDGAARPVAAFRMAKAILTGQSADDLGETAKLKVDGGSPRPLPRA